MFFKFGSLLTAGKRASFNSPAQVGGLRAWFDTTESAYLTLAGTAITQFLDRSGNGNHSEVQSNAALRPTLETNKINGLQAATFDSGGDLIRVPKLASIMNGQDKPCTVFAVVSTETPSSLQYFMMWGQNASVTPLQGYAFTTNQFQVNKRDDSGSITSRLGGDPVQASKPYVFSSRYSGTVVNAKAAGATLLEDSALDKDTTTVDNFSIGASDRGGIDSLHLYGTIAEVLIYDRELTAFETLQVEVYLANKFGLYHPSANWINSNYYTSEQQSFIHALSINRDDAYQDTTLNPFMAKYDAQEQAVGAIAAWLDTGGRGNDTQTQGTVGSRPTNTASMLNGKNALVFDGGDRLDPPTEMYTLANGSNAVFVVTQSNLPTTAQRILSGTEAFSSRYSLEYTATAGRIQAFNNTAASGAVQYNGLTKATPDSIAFYRDGSNQSLKVNGDTVATNTNANSEDGIDDMAIGSFPGGLSVTLDGYIAEMIVIDRAVTAAEVDAVQVILADKYGTYHPNATWITAFNTDQQALIHTFKLNKDDAFQNTAYNRVFAWFKMEQDALNLSGTSIVQYLDQGGKGNDSNEQATSTKRPTYDSLGSNSNGTSVYDGGDHLELPSDFYVLANGSNTIIVVCKSDNAGSTQRIFNMAESGSSRLNLQYDSSSGAISYQSRAAFGGPAITGTGVMVDTDYNVIIGRRDGTTQAISFNGTAEVTNTNGADEDGITGASIGVFASDPFATDRLDGEIAEMIILDSSASAAEIDSLYAYLGTKHNITIS